MGSPHCGIGCSITQPSLLLDCNILSPLHYELNSYAVCCLVKWSPFWLKYIIDRISIWDSSSLFLFFTLLYYGLVSRKEDSSFILSAGLHIINLAVSLLLYKGNKWANIWGNALQYSPCWENTLSECDDHKAPAKNSILFLSKNQFCWYELMGCMFCFFVFTLF